jgi:hypothetical protein
MRRVILALIAAVAVLGVALIINLSRQPGPKLTIDSPLRTTVFKAARAVPNQSFITLAPPGASIGS